MWTVPKLCWTVPELLWETLRKEQADPATRAREVPRDLANPPRLVGLYSVERTGIKWKET